MSKELIEIDKANQLELQSMDKQIKALREKQSLICSTLIRASGASLSDRYETESDFSNLKLVKQETKE